MSSSPLSTKGKKVDRCLKKERHDISLTKESTVARASSTKQHLITVLEEAIAILVIIRHIQ